MHVVTGASSGIGRGVMRALAERGAPVLAVARRTAPLEKAAGEAGHTVTAVTADVTTEVGRQAIAAAAGDAPIASLVHGAGSLVPLGAWTDLRPDDLLDHMRVHVAAPIALTSALLDRGAVERMAILDSYAATTPRHGWPAYAIIKAAAQMSARAAATELAGTAVARIFPGAVESPLLRTVLDGPADVPAVGVYRALADDGRVSDPADVGRQIAALLCDTPIAEFGATEVWHVGHPA